MTNSLLTIQRLRTEISDLKKELFMANSFQRGITPTIQQLRTEISNLKKELSDVNVERDQRDKEFKCTPIK